MTPILAILFVLGCIALEAMVSRHKNATKAKARIRSNAPAPESSREFRQLMGMNPQLPNLKTAPSGCGGKITDISRHSYHAFRAQ